MRFRDYTWPYNPEHYEITYQRQVAVHKIPFGRYCMQDLGLCYRTMRGDGIFTGAGAYDEFRKLAKVFYVDGPGLLVHPVWQPANAFFVSLELLEQPLPNYVHYAFEFWEDGPVSAQSGLTAVNRGSDSSSTDNPSNAANTAANPAGSVYTVRSGDTLWGIAKQHGVNLTELIRANPQIKNPNLIYPGNQVTIP